jgi:hypothetical protein
LGKIDRIAGRIAHTISDTFQDNRLGKYLSNVGEIHDRGRLGKLCEFFKRGKLYKGPCHSRTESLVKGLYFISKSFFFEHF